MNGIEFINETDQAKGILLKEGLLQAFGKEELGPGPRLRACLHRTPKHHILGLRFAGCKKARDNGYSVLLGDRGTVTPERWAGMVATILDQLGKAETCEPQLIDIQGGLN
jgi:hypothetical protein